MTNTTKAGGIALIAVIVSIILSLTGCSEPGSDNHADITYVVSVDDYLNTTAIDFIFSEPVSGLTADDINITNKIGALIKGALTGSGSNWSLSVTVNTGGNITVKITKSGIESGTKPVTVGKVTVSGSTGSGISGDFRYYANVSTISITGYQGDGGAVTIPAQIDGRPVTVIDRQAFYNCIDMVSVTIPNSVTEIGIMAFEGCTGLTNVTIPASVTSIGNSAFFGCTGLTSITIPNSVASTLPEAREHIPGQQTVRSGRSSREITGNKGKICYLLSYITAITSAMSKQ